MASTKCYCGSVMKAEGLEALVPVALSHFGEVHPELELLENNVRNYLEAEQRLTGPTEEISELGEVRITPVSAEFLDEILEFFDHRAFAGNPAWAMCYCLYHHLGGSDFAGWKERTWQENREELHERIRSGTTTGNLVWVDGVLAGWCNAGRRSWFVDKAQGTEEDEQVGSIVCSIIAPPYRNKELHKQLLSGTIDHMRSMGLERVEAYPNPSPQDPNAAYPGWPGRYHEFGFQTISEDPLVVSLDL